MKTSSGRECHDCGAKPGELHQLGCDVERCPLCGDQAIGCDCFHEMCENDPEIQAKFDMLLASKGGRIPWTGEWPGVAECAEFGWYSKFIPGRGWVQCNKDDPEAGPDLNRLAVEAEWDPKKRRYMKR
jgi:hypothetical protein